MSDMEDKLNSILSDSNAMGQIMALARSLSGGQSAIQNDSPLSEAENTSKNEFSSSSFGGLDPKVLDIAMKILSAYNSEDDKRANLLNALRPFVRKERYAKLDQAIQISKITRAARTALDAFRASEGGLTDV